MTAVLDKNEFDACLVPGARAAMKVDYAQLRQAPAFKAEAAAPEQDPAPDGLNAQELAERTRILELLQEHRWNKAQVARLLGVSKPTFFKRLHKYGLMDR